MVKTLTKIFWGSQKKKTGGFGAELQLFKPQKDFSPSRKYLRLLTWQACGPMEPIETKLFLQPKYQP